MSYKGKRKSNVYKAREGYDLYAPFYERDWKYLESFEKEIFWRLLGELKRKKILEVGCGSGRLVGRLKEMMRKESSGEKWHISEKMAGRQQTISKVTTSEEQTMSCGIAAMKEKGLTVLDISGEMIKIVKKKFPEVEAVVADVEALPFADESFEVVIASFLIVHLKSLEKAFAEIYRVLKEGGIFVLTNINQRKAPKLKMVGGKEKLGGGREIVIKSFYHRPEAVKEALEANCFVVEKEEFVYEKGVWVNQVVRARK